MNVYFDTIQNNDIISTCIFQTFQGKINLHKIIKYTLINQNILNNISILHIYSH